MTAYRLAQLDEKHDVSSFDCGEGSLSNYLRSEAQNAQASGEARTHVWLDADDRVVAYFTLMITRVKKNDLPRQLGIGRADIPGFLLAKLAVASDLRGRGLGPDLLLDALSTIVRGADAVGGRVIVVDALPHEKVHAFYASADFKEIPGSYTLWMKVSTAREVVAAA